MSDRVNKKRREERTDFLSFFDGCGGLGVETFWVGSLGGLVGFWVGSLGCLVIVGVVFCCAG